MCVSEYVHVCLAGFDVGVLSGVYHGGPMAVMNLLGQRLCVCVLHSCVLFSVENERSKRGEY